MKKVSNKSLTIWIVSDSVPLGLMSLEPYVLAVDAPPLEPHLYLLRRYNSNSRKIYIRARMETLNLSINSFQNQLVPLLCLYPWATSEEARVPYRLALVLAAALVPFSFSSTDTCTRVQALVLWTLTLLRLWFTVRFEVSSIQIIAEWKLRPIESIAIVYFNKPLYTLASSVV